MACTRLFRKAEQAQPSASAQAKHGRQSDTRKLTRRVLWGFLLEGFKELGWVMPGEARAHAVVNRNQVEPPARSTASKEPLLRQDLFENPIAHA